MSKLTLVPQVPTDQIPGTLVQYEASNYEPAMSTFMIFSMSLFLLITITIVVVWWAIRKKRYLSLGALLLGLITVYFLGFNLLLDSHALRYWTNAFEVRWIYDLVISVLVPAYFLIGFALTIFGLVRLEGKMS